MLRAMWILSSWEWFHIVDHLYTLLNATAIIRLATRGLDRVCPRLSANAQKKSPVKRPGFSCIRTLTKSTFSDVEVREAAGPSRS